METIFFIICILVIGIAFGFYLGVVFCLYCGLIKKKSKITIDK